MSTADLKHLAVAQVLFRSDKASSALPLMAQGKSGASFLLIQRRAYLNQSRVLILVLWVASSTFIADAIAVYESWIHVVSRTCFPFPCCAISLFAYAYWLPYTQVLLISRVTVPLLCFLPNFYCITVTMKWERGFYRKICYYSGCVQELIKLMPLLVSWLCFLLVSFDLMLSQQLSF